MEEESGGGDGAAGFGDDARGGDDGAHGGANLGFGDGDDAVHVGLNMGKVTLADALGAQPVGDGAAGELGGPGGDAAGAKAFGGVGGQLRLNAEYPGIGMEQFDRGRGAAEEAAAGYGRENK